MEGRRTRSALSRVNVPGASTSAVGGYGGVCRGRVGEGDGVGRAEEQSEQEVEKTEGSGGLEGRAVLDGVDSSAEGEDREHGGEEDGGVGGASKVPAEPEAKGEEEDEDQDGATNGSGGVSPHENLPRTG